MAGNPAPAGDRDGCMMRQPSRQRRWWHLLICQHVALELMHACLPDALAPVAAAARGDCHGPCGPRQGEAGGCRAPTFAAGRLSVTLRNQPALRPLAKIRPAWHPSPAQLSPASPAQPSPAFIALLPKPSQWTPAQASPPTPPTHLSPHPCCCRPPHPTSCRPTHAAADPHQPHADLAAGLHP